jgi:hypothetical protein
MQKRTRVDAVPFTRDANKPSLALILKVAADYFGLDQKHLAPNKASPPIVRQWRHITWYLCRTVSGRPYPAIMRALGSDKDASTIRDGAKTIANQLDKHKGIALTVAVLRAKIMEAELRERAKHDHNYSTHLPSGDRSETMQPGDGG